MDRDGPWPAAAIPYTASGISRFAKTPLQGDEHAVARRRIDVDAGAVRRAGRIVSDVRTIAETVTTTSQAGVFRVDEVADHARAVGTVLTDPARYRAAYDAPGLLAGWTWEAQADELDRVRRDLMVSRPTDAAAIDQQADNAEVPAHLRSAT